MTQEFGVATFGSAVGDSFIMPLPDREPVRRSDVLIIIICTLYHTVGDKFIQVIIVLWSRRNPNVCDIIEMLVSDIVGRSLSALLLRLLRIKFIGSPSAFVRIRWNSSVRCLHPYLRRTALGKTKLGLWPVWLVLDVHVESCWQTP